jgi:hypothetical protein
MPQARIDMSSLSSIKSSLAVLEKMAKGEEVDLDQLEKACAIWRSAAEAEKFEKESENAAKVGRAEATRFWSIVAAPVATVLILAGTLIFQVVQFNATSRATRAAEEEKQWRETLKTLADPQILSSIGGFVQLKSFFASPRYRLAAREYSLRLISARGGVIMLDVFEMIFPSAMEATNAENYQDIVEMLERMSEMYNFLYDKIQDSKSESGNSVEPGNNPPGPPPPPDANAAPPLSVQRDPEQMQRDLDTLDTEIQLTGDALAKFLRNHRRDINTLVLSKAALWQVDLSNLDFGSVQCAQTWFWRANLAGADLSGVTASQDSFWIDTAWWRAAKINKPLLEYLKEKYPFKDDPDFAYPGGAKATQQEYDAEVARLAKNAK